MSITLDWLHVISLLGAVQGFFLAGVLVTKGTNPAANRLLAAVTAAFSVYLASAVYRAAGWMEVFPHFFGVSNPLPLVFGPLIYLYAVHASDRTRRLWNRDLLHFMPATAVIIVTLPIYLKSGAEKIAFYQQLQQGDIPRLLQVIDWLKFVSGLSYTVATIRHLLRHRVTVMDSYSTVERVKLHWLLWPTSASAIVWAVATALHLRQVLSLPPRHGENLVALGIAITVYGIRYMELRQPEVFNFVTSEFPVVAATPAPPPDQRARYERSGLSDQEAESLKDALLAIMERERPHQNSELTLADQQQVGTEKPEAINQREDAHEAHDDGHPGGGLSSCRWPNGRFCARPGRHASRESEVEGLRHSTQSVADATSLASVHRGSGIGELFPSSHGRASDGGQEL